MNYFSKAAGRLAIAPLGVALLCSPLHLPTANAAEKPMIDVEEDQAKGTTIENQALALTRTEIGSRSVDLSDVDGHHLGCGLAAGFWRISKPEETKPGSAAYILAPTRLIQGRDELIVHFSDPTGTLKEVRVHCIREGAERNIFVGPLHAESVCAMRLPDAAAVSVPSEELVSMSYEPSERGGFNSGSDVYFTGGPTVLSAAKSLKKTLFLQTAAKGEAAVSAVSTSTPPETAGAPVYQLIGDPLIVENGGKKWLRSYTIHFVGLLDIPVNVAAPAPNPPKPSAKASVSPSAKESGEVQTFENATRLISHAEIAAIARSLREHLQSDGWVVPSPATSKTTPTDWRSFIPKMPRFQGF